MNKKDFILGKAKSNGLSREKLQRLSGIAPATFSRRMASPDSITIGELRRLDQLANFTDQDIIKLVRSSNGGK